VGATETDFRVDEEDDDDEPGVLRGSNPLSPLIGCFRFLMLWREPQEASIKAKAPRVRSEGDFMEPKSEHRFAVRSIGFQFGQDVSLSLNV